MEDRATLEGPKQPKRNKQAKKQANKQFHEVQQKQMKSPASRKIKNK